MTPEEKCYIAQHLRHDYGPGNSYFTNDEIIEVYKDTHLLANLKLKLAIREFLIEIKKAFRVPKKYL